MTILPLWTGLNETLANHFRAELLLELDDFVETIQDATDGLREFNGEVGGAVDIVISTTRWTNRILNALEDQASSRGALSSFIYDNVVAPFQPGVSTESHVLDQYIKHAGVVEEQIEKLIAEGDPLLSVLKKLENHLGNIHLTTIGDAEGVDTAKREVLSSLWAKLGGHRREINNLEKQSRLLLQLSTTRTRASTHVLETVEQLKTMLKSLQKLRDNVASPIVNRGKDTPLRVHIENIEAGVKRLEDQRRMLNTAEKEHYRSIKNRAPTEETIVGQIGI